MGFFDFLKMPDINSGIMDYKETKNAVLLDVRTPQEFKEGHIPGAKNLPLQKIQNAGSMIKNKERAVFCYCHSGARSKRAVKMMEKLGYTNVVNIGGISSYHGKLEYR